ncbi:transcription factor with AP2 domain(s), putative [Plasmodium knowlesi strain H]|uniref:Transcription factor with AP2 domain(S), putative n=3 Tax=Plasmodium knowlesi TaxID=5850 RepID=A0A5K1UJI5_PLAKH|nr:AP2 domain transcription factor AP2-G, putative [Plasmodium knowlesi strain H]OTN63645.1 putative AP2 family [Plasmodium knowlesi]CAA9991012.1 AP2 domain transcription factor AP2-G, putative [Plasmodium knowlesi strain H]SBO20719.1 transcription factor with AP2 domain(s), putative [Plasmodium knowlesi strain H]SBO21162.1 transcription factor with AP2 domain(s), putative [Plasmodium knowlesi strain H]VVS80486.1 AP2 domain transcription factor AP2-G, putative [Plasmodium knowlesi strain H]|eukprot:XP_002262295.1 AP2 family, putative [Plasmodium knowlesi strain H]
MQPQNKELTEKTTHLDTIMIGRFKSEHRHCGNTLTDNFEQKVNFTPCAAGESGNCLYALCTSQPSTTETFNLGITRRSRLSRNRETSYQYNTLIRKFNEEARNCYCANRNRQNFTLKWTLNRSKKVSNKSRAIIKRTGRMYQKKILSMNSSISSDFVSRGKKGTNMRRFEEGRFRRLNVLSAKKEMLSFINTDASALKDMFLGNIHRSDSCSHGGNIYGDRNNDMCVAAFKCCDHFVGHANCANYMLADATVGTEAALTPMEDRRETDGLKLKIDNSNIVDLMNEGNTHISEQREKNEHKEEICNSSHENINLERGKSKCSWKKKGLKIEKEQEDADKDVVGRSTLYYGMENKLEFPVNIEETSPSNNPPKDGRWRRRRTAPKNGSNVSAWKNVKKECISNTGICPNGCPEEDMNIEGLNDEFSNHWRNDEKEHYGEENKMYVPCITIEEELEFNNAGTPSIWLRNTEPIEEFKEHPEEESPINSCNKWNIVSKNVNRNVSPYESEIFIPYEEMEKEHAPNNEMMHSGIRRNEHMYESNLAVPLNHFNAPSQGWNYYMANKIGTHRTACLCTEGVGLSKGTQWNRNNYIDMESCIEELSGRSISEGNLYEGQHIANGISNEHASMGNMWHGYYTACSEVESNLVVNCQVSSHAVEGNPVGTYSLGSYWVDIYPVERYPAEIYPLASNWVGSNRMEMCPPGWVMKKDQCYSVPEVHAEEEAFASGSANPWEREEMGKEEQQSAHTNTCSLSSMKKEELTLPSNVTKMEKHVKRKVNVHSILNNNRSLSCGMKREIKMEVPDTGVYLTQGATSKLHTIADRERSEAPTARTSSIIPILDNDHLADTLGNQFDLENNREMLYSIPGELPDDRRLVCPHTHMLDANVSANIRVADGTACTALIRSNTNAGILVVCSRSQGQGENELIFPYNDVIHDNNEAFSEVATNSYYIPYPTWDNYPNLGMQEKFREYQYPYISSICPNECMSISGDYCADYPYNRPIDVNNSGEVDPKYSNHYFYPSWDNSLQCSGAEAIRNYNGICCDSTCSCNGGNICDENLGCNNGESSQGGKNSHYTDTFSKHGGNSCTRNTYHKLRRSKSLITQGYTYYQNDPQMVISDASNNLKDQYSQRSSKKRDSFTRFSVKGEYYSTSNTSNTDVISENSFLLIKGDNNSITGHIGREQMDPKDETDVIPDGKHQSDQYIHRGACSGTLHDSASNFSSYPVVNLMEGESYSPRRSGKWEVMPRTSNNNASDGYGRMKEHVELKLESRNVQLGNPEGYVEGLLPGDDKGGHTNDMKVKVKREASSDVQSRYESGNESDSHRGDQLNDQLNDQLYDLQMIAVDNAHNTRSAKNDESTHAKGESGEANSPNYCRTKCTTDGIHNYNNHEVGNLSADRANSIINSDKPYDGCFLEDDSKGSCRDALCTNGDKTFARQEAPKNILKNISACDRWNSGKDSSNLCSYDSNGRREYDACGYLSRINLPHISDQRVYKIRYPVNDGCSDFSHSSRENMQSNHHINRMGTTNQVNFPYGDCSRNYVNADPSESVTHITGDGSYPRDNFYNISDYQHSPNGTNYGDKWNNSSGTFPLWWTPCHGNNGDSLKKPLYFLQDKFSTASDEVKHPSVNKNNTNETNMYMVTNGTTLKKELKADTNSSEGTNSFRIKSEVANEDSMNLTNVPMSSECNSTLDTNTNPLSNNTYNLLSISTKCDSLGFSNDDGTRVHGEESPSGVNQGEKINTIVVEEQPYRAYIPDGNSNTFQIYEGNGTKDGEQVNTHTWGGNHFGTCVMENMETFEGGINLRKMPSSQMCIPRVKDENEGSSTEIGSQKDEENGVGCTPQNYARCEGEGDMHTNEEMRDEGSMSVNTGINERVNANNGDVSTYENRTQGTHDGNIVQNLNEMDTHLKNMNCMYTPEKYNYLNEAYFLSNPVNEVNFPNGVWQERNSLNHANYEEYIQQYSYSHSYMSGMGGNFNVERKGENADRGSGDNEDGKSDRPSDSGEKHTNGAMPHSIGMPIECANSIYDHQDVSGSAYYPGHIANNSNAIYGGMTGNGGNVQGILDQTGFDCMNSAMYNGTSPSGVNHTDRNIVAGYSYGYPSGLCGNYPYGYAYEMNTHSYADENKSVSQSCTLENTNGSTEDVHNISDAQVDRVSCKYIESDNDGADASDEDTDDGTGDETEDTDQEMSSENAEEKKASVSIVNVENVNNTTEGNPIITSESRTTITNLGSESNANGGSITRVTENSSSTMEGETSPNGVNSVKSESTACSFNETHKKDRCIENCKGEKMDHGVEAKSEKVVKRRGRKKNNSDDFKYAHEKKKELLKKKYNVQKDVVLTVEEGDLKLIAEEIIKNTSLLPERGPYGRNALDASHPIHSVWKDTSRGHSSWRCRWWENGKRLSKNYNVKRYGEEDALKMAIITKLRNSSPADRILYLNHQREFLNLCYANNWIQKRESDRAEADQDTAKITLQKDDITKGEKRSKRSTTGDMDAHETNKECNQEKDSKTIHLSVPSITYSTNTSPDDAKAPLHGNNLRRKNKRTLLTNTRSSKKCRTLKCYPSGPNTDTMRHAQEGDGTDGISERNAMHEVSAPNAVHVVNTQGDVKLEVI